VAAKAAIVHTQIDIDLDDDMTRYEEWHAPDDAFEFLPADHPQKAFLTTGDEPTWTVDADSWEEAMTKYHDHMGWEPYVPMDNGAP